jgi:Tol biopolymer transport system component
MRTFAKVSRRLATLTRSAIPSPRTGRFIFGGGPAVLTALLLFTPSLFAQDVPRPLTIEDQFAIKRVGSPQISPDGEWVAFTVSTTALKKERTRTQIWMVDTDGGDPFPVTMSSESISGPKWSPDGKYLSFLTSRGENAKTQVWVLDRRGGEAQQLTWIAVAARPSSSPKSRTAPAATSGPPTPPGW